ncbi:MAG: DUF2911 domain-containing protein [Myxococcota bacterium]
MTRMIMSLSILAAAVACAQANKNEVAPAGSQPAAPASQPAASEPAAETSLPAAPARGSDADRKSKNGVLEAELAGVPVRVHYGRPSVKGRKIFGDLIPYGKVWRTGADEATTISFAKSAMFAGRKVDRGTYALFTVPGEKNWKVVLNRQAKQWGAYKHDPSLDVLTAEVAVAPSANTEVLTFESADDKILLKWADVSVAMPVAAVH